MTSKIIRTTEGDYEVIEYTSTGSTSLGRYDTESEADAVAHPSISIYRDNVWAGDGRIVDGSIVDCAAVLGPDQDSSDENYEAIEDAISDGQTEITRPDGTYSWSLS